MKVYLLEAVDPELRRSRLARVARVVRKSRDAHAYHSKVGMRWIEKDPLSKESGKHFDLAGTAHRKAAKAWTVLHNKGMFRPGPLSYVRGAKALKSRSIEQAKWTGGKAHQSVWLSKGHLAKGSTYYKVDQRSKDRHVPYSFEGKFTNNPGDSLRALFKKPDGEYRLIHPHTMHSKVFGGSVTPLFARKLPNLPKKVRSK